MLLNHCDVCSKYCFNLIQSHWTSLQNSKTDISLLNLNVFIILCHMGQSWSLLKQQQQEDDPFLPSFLSSASSPFSLLWVERFLERKNLVLQSHWKLRRRQVKSSRGARCERSGKNMSAGICWDLTNTNTMFISSSFFFFFFFKLYRFKHLLVKLCRSPLLLGTWANRTAIFEPFQQ